MVESRADDGVHLVDGLGGAAGALCAAGGGEGVVEGVEVIGAETAEWDVTDAGWM